MSDLEREAQDWWSNVFLTIGTDIEPGWTDYVAHQAYLAGAQSRQQKIEKVRRVILNTGQMKTCNEIMDSILAILDAKE